MPTALEIHLTESPNVGPMHIHADLIADRNYAVALMHAVASGPDAARLTPGVSERVLAGGPYV